MGEKRKDALRLNFDRKLKLEFHRTKVTRRDWKKGEHKKRVFM